MSFDWSCGFFMRVVGLSWLFDLLCTGVDMGEYDVNSYSLFWFSMFLMDCCLELQLALSFWDLTGGSV